MFSVAFYSVKSCLAKARTENLIWKNLKEVNLSLLTVAKANATISLMDISINDISINDIKEAQNCPEKIQLKVNN
ncbi:hypothetical protein C1I91_23435 [Clostridium manihotivorum]|uniref:Uncharacterized protein n=1 Tax=Clostridium manihotivorum TaxID=2320868 RepID=A0A3R5U836_9CLOT|nr:hypothetical protein C1I91_23435 [Clostridium manihotivorum]